MLLSSSVIFSSATASFAFSGDDAALDGSSSADTGFVKPVEREILKSWGDMDQNMVCM